MTEFGDIVPDNRHTRGRDRVGVRSLAAAAVSSETDADNGIGPLFTGPAVPAQLALTIPAATPVTSSLPFMGAVAEATARRPLSTSSRADHVIPPTYDEYRKTLHRSLIRRTRAQP
ncbi:hypothetical protein [Gordonia aichiensis]|uniref:hypothetical protein n=1 Tax=Gordonia aichiensis TaxID=36820 RepID=UPI00058F9DFC|nr:hypothetical protein [Gordonia aichiensis]